MTIDLLIVTPNHLLGDALARALTSTGTFNVVDVRTDLSEATIAQAAECSILTLDSRFPEPPIAFIKEVLHRYPAVRIVIVQAPEFPQHVLPYIEVGAVGHVDEADSLSELVGVLETVHSGGAVIDPGLADLVIRQMMRLNAELGAPQLSLDGHHELTAREIEVLAEVAAGKSNAEIGESLFIQEGTVKNHVHNILRKLDLRDRQQAALWHAQWLRHQRVEADDSHEVPATAQPEADKRDPRDAVVNVGSTAQVRDGIRRALEVLCEQIGWPIGHVFLLDESNETLIASGIWRTPSDEIEPDAKLAIESVIFPVNKDPLGSAAPLGTPIYLPDIQQGQDQELAVLAATGRIRSVLLIPLIADASIIGMMAFFSTVVEEEPTDAAYSGLVEAGAQVSDFIDDSDRANRNDGRSTSAT